MKTFILTVLFSAAVFSEELFHVQFSQESNTIRLLLTTEKIKTDLAPLILKKQDIFIEEGTWIISLTITQSKKPICGQAFGKRMGLFYFEKGIDIIDGEYLLKINGREYGRVFVKEEISYKSFNERLM